MEFEDRVPFAARLESADRKALMDHGNKMVFPARHVLLREHEPSTHVLVLLSGWTKVTSASANGYEALLALRGPGDIVGEAATLSGRVRAATVTALSATEALAIDSAAFAGLLDARPALTRQLLALTADRTRDSDRRRVQFAALNVQERLALLLLELLHTHGRSTDEGTHVFPGLTQSELAGSVGASREAVARLLKGLRERGIVRTERRGITVLRPDVLRKMAGRADG
ncbi:Crp/Fnr family transcriptional regulator [Kitasatospora sp. YST-16]|uniref:Crp/Fnr family transcriptional regulator n=1 Tax=Kitasatospora sp. YST-16 TaxID=2998080 RepID=UPI00228390D3|nr:Crp/Fnr family transcriptional regulator [Kitasatospora sp. YST-16]WAL72554.1 Crp/Fnr family transcriptional regulator [Kitasatospora sp. YST-16]WNW38601.1 Crp/Fnr family transcriptional regulator [Streptomyces sp. Li-HN-5-13]